MSVRVVLASASPRRAALLRDAGFDVECMPADLDDGLLQPGSTTPRDWVLAMAWFKASRVFPTVLAAAQGPGALVAADTVCTRDGQIIGKPIDRDDAVRIVGSLCGRSHEVHTGVCVIRLPDGVVQMLSDVSTVTLGAMAPEVIRAYAESDEWHGKAGGYNYADRLAAGWPLTCAGDPTSVMGMPMERLRPILEQLEAEQAQQARQSQQAQQAQQARQAQQAPPAQPDRAMPDAASERPR